MSAEALLDVNLLIALFDPDHVHHELAHDWFADNRERGWATCALTENAFVRILSNPAYGSPIARPEDLAARLRKFCASGHHRFWSDSVSLADENAFNLSAVGSHRHITDIYLLGLALAQGGRLATFDRGIPFHAVVGATPRNLEIISPPSVD